ISLIAVSLTACGTSQPSEAQPSAPEPGSSTPQPEAKKEAWEVEWEETLELAKKEGEVLVVGASSAARENLMKEFEKAYPDIKVKYTGTSSRDANAKLISEQQQGRFLSDIMLEKGTAAVESVRDYI